jgi:hypothetical protein
MPAAASLAGAGPRGAQKIMAGWALSILGVEGIEIMGVSS